MARAVAAAIWHRLSDLDDAITAEAGAPATKTTGVGQRVDVVVSVAHTAGGKGSATITAFAGYAIVSFAGLPPIVCEAAREAAREIADVLDLRPQSDLVWRDCGVCPDIAVTAAASFAPA